MVFVWYNTKFEFWWNDSVFKMQTHVRSCRTGDWDRPRRKLWRQLSMTRQNLSWNWISILSTKIKLENTNYMIDIYMRFLFLNMSTPASFRFFLHTNNTIFTTNQCEKMSIQNTALGFEPTTSWTWVVTHNHQIKAPAGFALSYEPH